MNRTQKGACFTLAVAILLLFFEAIVFASMIAPGDRTAGTGLVKVWIWFILVFLAGGAVFVHWKRKPSDVDFDERDTLIKKNAVLVSFVSLWFLLFAVSIIPTAVFGQESTMPVCLLPLVNFGVFMVAIVFYSLSVLVQYCLGGKENE
jgi:uncharacterized membrane-anchored protein